MPVATTQLVTLLFIFVVDCCASQLIQVVFEGDQAIVANHWVPLWDDTYIPSALVVGNGAVIVSVINMEAPATVLPQGAIPFSIVGLFVTALKTVREVSALALVTLVLGDGVQLEAIFTLDITPLILGWSLSCEKTG